MQLCLPTRKTHVKLRYCERNFVKVYVVIIILLFNIFPSLARLKLQTVITQKNDFVCNTCDLKPTQENNFSNYYRRCYNELHSRNSSMVCVFWYEHSFHFPTDAMWHPMTVSIFMQLLSVKYFTRKVKIFLNLVIKHGAALGNVKAGYIPGVGGMTHINKTDCLNDELRRNPSLSSALECARTCNPGEKPRICYYHFTLERYPVNGLACALCTPNVTNSVCANCQCIPGDGVNRMALTVNRMMPGPSIQVCEGDYLVIDVLNHIDGEAVTIHWHGLYQKGTQYYDGVPTLTQCPINSGNTFRYQFYASNSGTHFWHAHTALHKMDGIFGSLIVRKPTREDPNSCLYNFDVSSHVILINDWMHEQATERFPGRNLGVTGQSSDAFLINGKGRSTNFDGSRTNTSFEVFTVEAKQRYRFRLINAFCTTCASQFTIEGHTLTVIAVDGQSVLPVKVNTIASSAGERIDFILNADQPIGSYWIQLQGIDACNDIQQLAVLQYTNASTIPTTEEPDASNSLPPGIILNPYGSDCSQEVENGICINGLRAALEVDKNLLQKKPDLRFYFSPTLHPYTPEDVFRPNTYKTFAVAVSPFIDRTAISNISFVSPPSPPLSQINDIPDGQFCNSNNLPPNCDSTSCSCTHMVDIKRDAVVEVVLIDRFGAPNIYHPFHLHGFHYHVFAMGQPFGPLIDNNTEITLELFKEMDKNNQIKRNFDYPPGKDTIAIPNNGYVIFRFLADNPGYWLLHCHTVFHQIVGMETIMHVGKREDLPPVPKNFPKCGNYVPKIKSPLPPSTPFHSLSVTQSLTLPLFLSQSPSFSILHVPSLVSLALRLPCCPFGSIRAHASPLSASPFSRPLSQSTASRLRLLVDLVTWPRVIVLRRTPGTSAAPAGARDVGQSYLGRGSALDSDRGTLSGASNRIARQAARLGEKIEDDGGATSAWTTGIVCSLVEDRGRDRRENREKTGLRESGHTGNENALRKLQKSGSSTLGQVAWIRAAPCCAPAEVGGSRRWWKVRNEEDDARGRSDCERRLVVRPRVAIARLPSSHTPPYDNRAGTLAKATSRHERATARLVEIFRYYDLDRFIHGTSEHYGRGAAGRRTSFAIHFDPRTTVRGPKKSVSVTVNATALRIPGRRTAQYFVEYTALIRTPVNQAYLKDSWIPPTRAYPTTDADRSRSCAFNFSMMAYRVNFQESFHLSASRYAYLFFFQNT
ncbi:uncharacterized protein LOC143180095 [Calliopsis andreniformis]|uniref:uncharacterized protein LOC143180095 n=1 Tax=Calliopsis andreniformis TaxID=337506 RepID=UPI003FCC342D